MHESLLKLKRKGNLVNGHGFADLDGHPCEIVFFDEASIPQLK